MKFTKDEITAALKELGGKLGFDVNVPKANSSDEGDPEGAAIVVHFNEAGSAELAALVTEFGGIDNVRKALKAGLAFEAKANAEAKAEEDQRKELIAALAENEELGMTANELEGLPTRVLSGLVRPVRATVNHSLRAPSPAKKNSANIAPRPSVLLRQPAAPAE